MGKLKASYFGISIGVGFLPSYHMDSITITTIEMKLGVN